MQSPIITFTSPAFPIQPGEDAATNPGIFGRGLATWLAESLRGHGIAAGDVIAEDFGWCVPIPSRPHKTYVACAGAGETGDRWRIFVFAEGGLLARMFGRDRRAESLQEVFSAVHDLLSNRHEVHDLGEEAV